MSSRFALSHSSQVPDDSFASPPFVRLPPATATNFPSGERTKLRTHPPAHGNLNSSRPVDVSQARMSDLVAAVSSVRLSARNSNVWKLSRGPSSSRILFPVAASNSQI